MDVCFMGRANYFMRDNSVMDYFRSEYKQDANYAYEYWKSTGKMNWSF
jgi:hypothetical protein